jgi:hypothetical protein
MNILSLSPTPYAKQVDKENLVEIKTKLSKPLEAYSIAIKNHTRHVLL